MTGTVAASRFVPTSLGACSCEPDEPDTFALELVSVVRSDGAVVDEQYWPKEAVLILRDLGPGEPGILGLEESPSVVSWVEIGAAR